MFSFDVAVAEVLEMGEKVEGEHAASLQFEREMIQEEVRGCPGVVCTLSERGALSVWHSCADLSTLTHTHTSIAGCLVYLLE